VSRKWILMRAIAFLFLSAATGRGQQAPSPEPSPGPQSTVIQTATPSSPVPVTSPSENQVIDNIEQAIKQHEQSQPTKELADPNKPRMHRFTDQPVGTVLRVLAEEAGINYVEPGIS
jgi:hypothetical protein